MRTFDQRLKDIEQELNLLSNEFQELLKYLKLKEEVQLTDQELEIKIYKDDK